MYKKRNNKDHKQMKLKTEKDYRKSMKSKAHSLKKKINKINKPLAKLIKNKSREDTNYQYQE